MWFSKRKKQPFIKVTQLSSLIAAGVEITGDVAFAGGMRIDGRVQGNVTGRSVDGQVPALLVLSNQGRIDGSVHCGNALINGTIFGDLEIEHLLELQSEALVRGTIRYRQLQMDVGATVDGHLLRADPPAAADNVVELGAEKSPASAERR